VEFGGEVGGLDGGEAQGEEALGAIFKFADVARPGVRHEGGEGGGGEDRELGGGGEVAGEEGVKESGHVAAALAEAGEREAVDVEAVEEVFAEGAVGDGRFEVDVGGGEDAGVERAGFIGADGAELVFLEGAEEFDLELEGELADFVEKEGAFAGLGEEAMAVGVGAGEGAFDVAEELAFDEVGGEAAAVDDDKGEVAAGAGVVDGAGDEFLACAGLAGDEDGLAGGGDVGDLAEELLHAGGVADEAGEFVAGLEAGAHAAVFEQDGAAFGEAVDAEEEVLGGEGFGDVVVGAELHGGDGGGDGGVAGHEEDIDAGFAGIDLEEEVETGHGGQDEVGEDDVDVGGAQFGEGLFGGGGGEGAIAIALEESSADGADAGIVVDDEDENVVPGHGRRGHVDMIVRMPGER